MFWRFFACAKTGTREREERYKRKRKKESTGKLKASLRYA